MSLQVLKPGGGADDERLTCSICDDSFGMFTRKHHCRCCGCSVCAKCSDRQYPLLAYGYELFRVCVSCYYKLTEAEGKDWSQLLKPIPVADQREQPPGAFGAETKTHFPSWQNGNSKHVASGSSTCLSSIYAYEPIDARFDCQHAFRDKACIGVETFTSEYLRSQSLFGTMDVHCAQLLQELHQNSVHHADLQSFGLSAVGLHQAYQEFRLHNERVQSVALAGRAEEAKQMLEQRDLLLAECMKSGEKMRAEIDAFNQASTARSAYLNRVAETIESTFVSSGHLVYDPADIGEYSNGVSGKDLEALVNSYTEWHKWKQETIGPYSARTQECIKALREAYAAEQAVVKEHEERMKAGMLMACGIHYSSLKLKEKVKAELAGKGSQTLNTLQRKSENIMQDLKRIQAEQSEIRDIRSQLARASVAIVSAKEKLIDLHANLERQKLRNDLPEKTLAQLEGKVAEQKSLVSEAIAGNEAMMARLRALAKGDHPELLCLATDDSPLLPQRMMETGFVVDRTFSDYEQLGLISGNGRHNVYLCRWNKRDVVLKQIPIQDKSSLGKATTEVSILQRVQHPRVVVVEAVFYNNLMCYLQMPYYSGGTLRQFLSNTPCSAPQRQQLLQQVLQGLAYLHDKGIVHADLKEDNVLMTSRGEPVICDFGISRQSSAFNTMTMTMTMTTMTRGGPISGTRGYMAPEVESGQRRASKASDIYAFGVILFHTFFPDAPVTPRKIPAHSNPSLRQLLSELLSADYHRRPTAMLALCHPFFLSSVDGNEAPSPAPSSGALSPTPSAADKRLVRLQAHMVSLMRGTPNKVSVSPDMVAVKLLERFDGASANEVLRPLLVEYAMPSAGTEENDQIERDPMDAFWLQVSHTSYGLFSGPSAPPMVEASPWQPSKHVFSDAGHSMYVLPNVSPCNHPKMMDAYVTLGKLLLKCLLENRPVAAPFAPSLYRFLIGKPPTFNDLEVFDAAAAFCCRQVIALGDERPLPLPVSQVFLGFAAELAASSSNPTPRHEELLATVNSTPSLTLVNWLVTQQLVTCRAESLGAIRKGFCTVDLSKYLSAFSATDLRLLLSAQGFVSVDALLNTLTFTPSGWEDSSPTPRFLKEWLRSCPVADLRRFLCFTTTRCYLPESGLRDATGLMKTLTVVRVDGVSLPPSADPVDLILHLPDYQDETLLHSQFVEVLDALP